MMRMRLQQAFMYFLRLTPSVIVLGLFLGAAIVLVPDGLPRYLVSAVVIIFGIIFYCDCQKERQEERLAEKILQDQQKIQ